MQRQWDGKTRGGKAGYSIFIKVLRTLGLGPAYALLCLVVPYFTIAAPAQTRSVWRYSRRILKLGRWRSFLFLFQSYFAFGKAIIDRVAVNCGFEDAFSYEFENHQAMLCHLSEGCGVVMIGAHTGSWQMGFPFADSYGAKVNVVMFDNEVKEVKKVLEGQTRDRGIKVIPVAEGDISSIFAIRDALSRGEVVSFQGDRYMEGNRVLEAEFLGHKAFFPAGPFIIASKLQVKVVFYFAMREKGRRYRFIFREATAGAGPQALLDEYVAALDDVLSRYPQQWFNYYDFWNLG